MTASKPSDPTFRSYTPDQARRYAESRPSYPPKLYDTILRHHAATGGRFDVLVDVGCGPGTATRDLAASFARAVGLDAGEEMIATARRLGGMTAKGEPVRFFVSEAERIADAEGVEKGSVDLLTSAMAVRFILTYSVLISAVVETTCSRNDTGALVLHARVLGAGSPTRQAWWNSGPVDMLVAVLP